MPTIYALSMDSFLLRELKAVRSVLVYNKPNFIISQIERM